MITAKIQRRAGVSLWLTPLLYSLAIAGYPLFSSLCILLHFEDSRPISITFRLLFLLISGALITHRFKTIQVIGCRGFAALALFFWSILLLRLIWDGWVAGVSMVPSASDYLMYGLAVAWIPALAFINSSFEELRLARKMTLLVSAISIVAVWWIVFVIKAESPWIGRMSTQVLNPISLGHLSVSFFLILFTLILDSFDGWRWWRLVLASAFLLGGMLTTAMAASKGPVLAFVLCTFLLSIYWNRKPLVLRIGLAFSVCGLLLGILWVVNQNTIYKPIIRVTGVSQDASNAIRSDLLRNSVEQALGAPILGSALVEKNSRTYPHNILIESFLAGGVISGICMMILIAIGVGSALKSVRGHSESAWVAILYLQYLIDSMLSGALFLSPHFWYFSFATVALAADFDLIDKKGGALVA